MYGTRGTLQQGKKPPPQEVASTFSCLQENASNTVPGYPEGFTPSSHGPKALMLKAGIGAEGDPGPPRAIDSQVCLIPGLPHSWPLSFFFWGGGKWGDVFHSSPLHSLTAQTLAVSWPGQETHTALCICPKRLLSNLPALTRLVGRVHAGSGPAGSWRWGLGREGVELR